MAIFPEIGEPELPVVLEPDVLDGPSEQQLERRATDLVSAAKSLTITDAASFELAGAMLDTLKTQKRNVEEFFKPDIERAHAAWKGLTTKRATFVEPLDEAITGLSARYGAFAREAREAAERERKRLEKEAQDAERERLRKESVRLAEEARQREAEAESAPTRSEALQLQQDADDLKTQSAAVADDAAHVQAPVIPAKPIVETPKGVSVRSNWKHNVDDLMALVKAVAAGDQPLQAVQANDVYLGQRARADKGTAKIPGVRFFDATSVAHRRTR